MPIKCLDWHSPKCQYRHFVSGRHFVMRFWTQDRVDLSNLEWYYYQKVQQHHTKTTTTSVPLQNRAIPYILPQSSAEQSRVV